MLLPFLVLFVPHLREPVLSKLEADYMDGLFSIQASLSELHGRPSPWSETLWICLGLRSDKRVAELQSQGHAPAQEADRGLTLTQEERIDAGHSFPTPLRLSFWS